MSMRLNDRNAIVGLPAMLETFSKTECILQKNENNIIIKTNDVILK